MPVHEGTATLVGMIPLALDEGEMIGPQLAKDWLIEWAGDYISVLIYGLECENASDRSAYGMLAVDLRYTVDAMSCVIATGKPVEVQYENLGERGSAAERLCLCRHLARICATRPTHSTGPFEAVYEDLARRIVELLDEPREAA